MVVNSVPRQPHTANDLSMSIEKLSTAWRPPAPAPRSSLRVGLQLLTGQAPDLLALLPRSCYRQDILSVPIGRRRVFIVNEPATVRRVLNEDRAFYPKSDLMVSTLEPLIGEGVLVSSGPRWEHDRKMLEPAFMQMRLEKLFPKMMDAVSDWMARLSALPPGSTIELEEELSRVTADIMLRTLFSEPISGEDAARLFERFTSFQRNCPKFNPQVILHSRPEQPEPLPAALLEDARSIRGLLEKLLDQRLAQRAAGKTYIDLAQSVIDARDPSGRPFTREQTIDQLAVFFLAGHETTASGLAWTFFILAQQPQWVAALREDIHRHLGSRPFQFEDHRTVVTARTVFRESLRLYPPVAFLTRQALREDCFDRHRVPAGSFVVISPWVIHRHQRYWQNADRFDPTRFNDDRGLPSPGSYLPFGLGPRACTGAMMAQLEASLILVETWRRFSFETLQPGNVFPITRISVRMRQSLPCRLHRAAAA